jgi:hypothetical protein
MGRGQPLNEIAMKAKVSNRTLQLHANFLIRIKISLVYYFVCSTWITTKYAYIEKYKNRKMLLERYKQGNSKNIFHVRIIEKLGY